MAEAQVEQAKAMPMHYVTFFLSTLLLFFNHFASFYYSNELFLIVFKS